MKSAVEISLENKSLKERSANVDFEEALERTGFGIFNYFLVVLSGGVLSAVLLETLGISFILPIAECDLKLTTKNKGLLSAVSFIGIIASSHLWGFLADTRGRRKIIMPTLFVAFAISIASSFVKSFWILTLLRFLNGVFISGGSATIYAYLGEFHDSKSRSRVIMGAAFVFGVVCLAMPLLAFVILNQDWQFSIPLLEITYKPWRFFFVVCGVLDALCGICFVFLPESPKFVFASGDEEETLKILEKIYRINNNTKDDYGVKEIIKDSEHKEIIYQFSDDEPKCCFFDTFKLMWDQTAPLFRKEHLKNTAVICIVQFMVFLTSNGLYMFFPEILNRIADYTKHNVDASITICGIVDATRNDFFNMGLQKNDTEPKCTSKLDLSTYKHSFVLEAVYAVGFAVMGAAINYAGRLALILFVLLGCGGCAITIIYVTNPSLSVYLYIILLACGLVCNVVNTSTVELYPTNLRAMAVCISLMFGRLGSVFGSNLMGLLLDSHCNLTLAFSGGALLISSFLVFLIPNISKRNLSKKIEIEVEIEKL